MADYFTQFSTNLDVGSPQNVEKALAIFDDIKAWYPEKNVDPDLTDAGFDAIALTNEPNVIWISDQDGHGNVEAVIAYVLHIAKELELDGRWGFQWAYSCSKARLDGFGGGAHMIDLTARASVAWVDTDEWLTLNAEPVEIEAERSTVFVVTIAYRHGEDMTVYAKAEDALECVARFAREWWSKEGVDPETTAETFEQAHGTEAMIDRYFEHMEHESFSVTEMPVHR